jgi:hypothetical protein
MQSHHRGGGVMVEDSAYPLLLCPVVASAAGPASHPLWPSCSAAAQEKAGQLSLPLVHLVAHHSLLLVLLVPHLLLLLLMVMLCGAVCAVLAPAAAARHARLLAASCCVVTQNTDVQTVAISCGRGHCQPPACKAVAVTVAVQSAGVLLQGAQDTYSGSGKLLLFRCCTPDDISIFPGVTS